MNDACKIKVAGRPCESCPWRKDRDACDIPEFSLRLSEKLAATCPDEKNMGPDFGASWFACHLSHEGSEMPCAGWLAMVGHAHPSVRMAVRERRLSPEALHPPSDGPDLHERYCDVLEKLRRTADEDAEVEGDNGSHP
jgi:hypothetical protein